MWEAALKILHFTDPHFSAVAPASRIDDYQATCFRKLDEIRDIAKKEKVDIILCSGDFFHLKSWMRNPYSLTNRLIDYFNSLPCDTIGIFGDHDLPDRNADSLARQPLSTLCKASKLKLLNKGEVFNHWNQVIITGAPKTDNYEADITNYIPIIDLSQELKAGDTFKGVHIHMSHGDLYPNPPVYEPYTLYSRLAGSTVDFHFNGHVHDDLGEIKVNSKTRIINRGSMTRGSLTESNINRKITVTLLDTDTKTLKYFPLKSALPPEKVFDLKKRAESEQAEAEINKLGELIRHESQNVELSGPESIRHMVKELNSIKEPVKTKIYELLDRAEEAV